MVTNAELRSLVTEARARGAVLRCRCEGDDGDNSFETQHILEVQVRYGTIPGIGDGWMPAIEAAELLREWLSRPMQSNPRNGVLVTGVSLRRVGGCDGMGGEAVVSLEMHGQWIDVITEPCDANFSHIIEPSGILAKVREAAER